VCNPPRTASERFALGSPRVLRFWSADRDDRDELPTDCTPGEVADGFTIQFRKIYRIRGGVLRNVLWNYGRNQGNTYS